MQCLTTDEAGWTYHSNTDPLGIHQMTWSSNNQTVAGLYYRSYFQITLCNEFIRQCSDENLASRNITGADADNIRQYQCRSKIFKGISILGLDGFICKSAFYYRKRCDRFRSILPKQIKRKDLFDYIESELKELDTELVSARHNEYGRADQAAAWALLARIYLNAEVYTGTPRYTDAITYCNKVIEAGYTLHPDYTKLMLADNNLNTDEFIFSIEL